MKGLEGELKHCVRCKAEILAKNPNALCKKCVDYDPEMEKPRSDCNNEFYRHSNQVYNPKISSIPDKVLFRCPVCSKESVQSRDVKHQFCDCRKSCPKMDRLCINNDTAIDTGHPCSDCGIDIRIDEDRCRPCWTRLQVKVPGICQKCNAIVPQGLTLCEKCAFQHNDPVNHPKHYNNHPSGIECIKITRHMGFNLGNAIKYLWRADLKGASIEDLKKAVWYIQDEIMVRESK